MSDTSKTNAELIDYANNLLRNEENLSPNMRAIIDLAEALKNAEAALEAATRVPVRGEPNDGMTADGYAPQKCLGCNRPLKECCLSYEEREARARARGYEFVRDGEGEPNDDRDAALAAIERVRAIHRRAPHPVYASAGAPDVCTHCHPSGNRDFAPYPCPTIQALDGAPEPEAALERAKAALKADEDFMEEVSSDKEDSWTEHIARIVIKAYMGGAPELEEKP